MSRRDFMDYTPEDLARLTPEALDYLSKFIAETVHYDFRHEDPIHTDDERKALYRENNTRKEDIYKSTQRRSYDTLIDDLNQDSYSNYEDLLVQALDNIDTLSEGPEYPSPYCFCLLDQDANYNLGISSRRAIVRDLGQACSSSRRDRRRRRYLGYSLS